jgi:lactoylglutathione lyase
MIRAPPPHLATHARAGRQCLLLDIESEQEARLARCGVPQDNARGEPYEPDHKHCGDPMRYLHTMVRVADLDKSLDFYCGKLGLEEVRRMENPTGRFTLVFLAAPGDATQAKKERAPLLELTYNWDAEDYGPGRNFGHLAFEVDDIYTVCQHLKDAGVVINRPPRDGRMAFVRSPDAISIEILQKGPARAPKEPWASMPNTGTW